ncbi:maleylacetoacetate isomerase [Bacterioplanes sanyensis]|uniref:Maleylacetoacetate isomerase n=1 Tax=Bacterioplanes sanyensis TaxID=1249553 RepID=A0A222FJQ0_9GAMM|nr:maleylacetoacetate isomerase [Bacterioplanes sanyensis]ASP39000.1 maleylacetoacetate isomerase [Bacterioplanes sanyensis]
MMTLYDYWRSSAAYRVRIALNLKGIAYERVPVDLRLGEQGKQAHLSRQPQGLVPALQISDDECLTQSLAILEWLEEEHPDPALLPKDATMRARTRSLMNQIAADIHPLNNLRVLKYLVNDLGLSEEKKTQWYHHWIGVGFSALEKQLGDGPYCMEDKLTYADVCLIPQVYNAYRFEAPMAAFPKIRAVYEHCLTLSAFSEAAPEE